MPFPNFRHPLGLLLGLVPALGWADTETLRQQVVCAETGFSRAAEDRDLDRFLSFVDPDARFVNVSVAEGREAIARAWASVFLADGPSMRWRPQFTEVSSDGRLALSRGPFRSVQTGPDGETIESWGHFISTWRRAEDGRWLVLFDSGGDAGMTPTEAEIALLNGEPDCP